MLLARTIMLLIALTAMHVKAQGSEENMISRTGSIELGQAILLLMTDSQQKIIDWDYRSDSNIKWVDSGYTIQKNSTGGELKIRRGLIRINVRGKPSTVLRQRKQELWWTVRFEAIGNPSLGVAEIWLEPGSPTEPCFGSLYENCAFDILPSLKSAGINWREVCKYRFGSDQSHGYILSNSKHLDTQILVVDSGGSGGVSTSIMLRIKGDPKKLCPESPSISPEESAARTLDKPTNSTTESPSFFSSIFESAGLKTKYWVAVLQDWLSDTLFVSMPAILVAVGIVVAGISKKCPKCGKWFAAEENRKDLIHEETKLRTVTRQDKIRDKQGSLVGTVDRDEQIQVTLSTWLNHYRCKNCNHEWSSESYTEKR